MYTAEVNYAVHHRDEPVVRQMIAEHNGTVILAANTMHIIGAEFENEDERDTFEVELSTYNAQQDWLDMNTYEDMVVDAFEIMASRYETWNDTKQKEHEDMLESLDEDSWLGEELEDECNHHWVSSHPEWDMQAVCSKCGKREE